MTEDNVSTELTTGDEVELVIGTLGRTCDVRVNGKRFPGACSFKVQTDLHGATRLEIEALFPYPPQRTIEAGQVVTITRTLKGIFVEEKDAEDFIRFGRAKSHAHTYLRRLAKAVAKLIEAQSNDSDPCARRYATIDLKNALSAIPSEMLED